MKIIGLALALVLAVNFNITAQVEEDTTFVQTFTYGYPGSPKKGTFEFPSADKKFRKIYMRYRLKCVDGNNPACGEWDYLTYINLFHPTGKFDSTRFEHANFQVNNTELNSYRYSLTPTFSYFPSPFQEVELTDTIDYQSFSSPQITGTENFILNRSGEASFQFIISKTQLNNMGVSAGELSGFDFFLVPVNSTKSNINLQLELGHTSDSIPGESPDYNTTQVYNNRIELSNTELNLNFRDSFVWNGTENLIIKLCVKGKAGEELQARMSPVNYTAGRSNLSNDPYFTFNRGDKAEVPIQALANIDSFITISLWQRGNDNQPRNNYTFEGVDANGNRVINAHLPWGNSRVYWDCGNEGNNYDRIDKLADESDFKNKWNHWAFVKDVEKGRMEIYLNGQLWHSGTSKNRTLSPISQFYFGAGNRPQDYYDGDLDEFRIYSKALSASEIKTLFERRNETTDKLRAYFDGSLSSDTRAKDQSINAYDAKLTGIPQQNFRSNCNLNFDDSIAAIPAITFERATYLKNIRTKYYTDSQQVETDELVLYSDPQNPDFPTDTLISYEAGYRYTFDSKDGSKLDSSLVPADNDLSQEIRVYYSEPFEIIDRIELGRYITPYGIGLDLGDGWTWVYDVTDYTPFLRDSVYLEAGNWQEELDMQFVMIEGEPTRDVVKLTNLWKGSPTYDLNIETNALSPIEHKLSSEASTFKLRMRTTGHGFGGNENCAEFCQKEHSFKVNGTKRFGDIVWNNECPDNPLHPQGGTWLFPRAGWCPGDKTQTYDYELTPYVNPGEEVTLDYDVEPYERGGGGSRPYWRIETQLIEYGPIRYENNAAVSKIISPNFDKLQSRFNPSCDAPIIEISNQGKETLTSLNIEYGVKGGKKSNFEWEGSLEFEETEVVVLPYRDWGEWSGDNLFEVNLSQPNGETDELEADNYRKSYFELPEVFPNKIAIWFRTNNAGSETSYKIERPDGSLVFEKKPTSPNTLFRDTIEMQGGCHILKIEDSGFDGLSFFANNDGNGFINIFAVDQPFSLARIEPNFGEKIELQFMVDWSLKRPEVIPLEQFFKVYPNPASSRVTVELPPLKSDEGCIEVYDMMGRRQISKPFNQKNGSRINLDLSELKSQIYVIRITTDQDVYSKEILVK